VEASRNDSDLTIGLPTIDLSAMDTLYEENMLGSQPGTFTSFSDTAEFEPLEDFDVSIFDTLLGNMVN
jgi:hypothetical protein